MKVENKQINQKKQDSEGMSSDNPSEFLKTSRIMKKTILLLACMLSAISGYAQLKVNSSGQVGIGTTKAEVIRKRHREWTACIITYSILEGAEAYRKT